MNGSKQDNGIAGSSDKPKQELATGDSRRRLLKLLGSGTAITAVAHLPAEWKAPIVDTVLLPAHAEGSPSPVCVGEKTKSDDTICCDELDATNPDILDECCDKAGLDADGHPVTNEKGVWVCCDDADPNSDDYKQYCCDNKAVDSSGNPVTDDDGMMVCCEGSDKSSEHCCIIQTQTYSISIPLERTNWTTRSDLGAYLPIDIPPVPKWSKVNGPLGRIEITVIAKVNSESQIENKDSSQVEVSFSTSAELITEGPEGVLAITQPIESLKKTLPPGDKTLDFQGDSAWNINELLAEKSTTIEITDESKLAMYEGSGDLQLNVTATAKSAFTSTGANSITNIDTFAEALVTITYHCIASEA